MQGTRGMEGMLYSGKCHQTFRGMLSNIPGNVIKHSGKCHQTFLGTPPNITGNVANFGVKGRDAFRILSNIHDGALLRK